MKKHLSVIAGIMFFLAVFSPLASSSPDGLERVVENFGIQETAPIWNGIMSDYAIAAIANPYISTLIAGILGTLMVLVATYLLGMVIETKKKPISETH
jgi:hypothetical protein